MLRLALLLLLIPTAAAAGLSPIFDLRVRQEIFDGVYYFAPESDRNWIRVRTRVGGNLDLGGHRLSLRLTNGHRHMLTPDQDLNWDEVIIDNLYWRWSLSEDRKLTVGRQEIIWPGGFLMLEGHPLDGSRSIYHNAVRLQWVGLDGSFIHNPKYDDFVLIDDQHRPLTDMDETGGYLRYVRDGWAFNLIGKFESDPDDVLDDLTTTTGSIRHGRPFGETGKWHADLAVQYQDGTVRAAADDKAVFENGWAYAGEGFVSHGLGGKWTGEVGGFWYSGLDCGVRPFRTPWGRWPKWSEMYIYSLIGESTPGRVHVAAWEDIAAPRVALRSSLNAWLDARLVASYLFSPVYGEGRGLLTEINLMGALGRGLKAHLLWERLDPGPFHDGRHGLSPMNDPVHFLRWEISWAL